MTRSTFYPPNCHWLSEDVIGAVSERCLPAHHRLQVEQSTSDANLTRNQCVVQSTEAAENLSTIEHLAVQDPSPIMTTAFADTKPRDSRKNVGSDANQDQVNSKAANAVNVLKQRREQRRLTQIRYRKKLREHAATVEKEVQILREKVYRLEMQRQKLSPRMVPNSTALSVAAEYFRLFRYGLAAYVPPQERLSTPGAIFPYEARAQRDFLFATVADEATCQSGRGPEALLNDWRLTTLSQPDVDVQVVRLDNGPDDAVVATTRVGVVISESTLRNSFPHLSKSERGRSIASMLLRQRFVMNSTTVVEWNSEKCRVVGVHTTTDVVTPMLRLLSSLEDLSFLFDNAHITLDATLVTNSLE